MTKQSKVVESQPLANVQWVKRESLKPNTYNPNAMATPEAKLLKISILENGWTQPIVVFRDVATGECWIVDGEHRWQASADEAIAAMTDGLVPVVFIEGDAAMRMMATIRHNRARGSHGVLPMAAIAVELLDLGRSDEEICRRLGMEREELGRLAERHGRPEVMGRYITEFKKGWEPYERNDEPVADQDTTGAAVASPTVETERVGDAQSGAATGRARRRRN